MSEKAAVWEDINVLVPWSDNPRHNQSAIQSVADSIKRFGFASPIIAREADKMIIAGHTRLEAAKSLGLDRVPVRYLDLDPADAKMLALADNKVGEIADWDDTKLKSVLAELREQEYDISGLGWNGDEIESILDDVLDYDDYDDVSSDDEEGAVSADLRQVVMWFTPEEHEVFLSCIQSLSSRLGTENQTQTVLEALKNA